MPKYVSRFKIMDGEDILIRDAEAYNVIKKRFSRNLLIIADSYGDTIFSGDNTNSKTFIDYLGEIIPNNWTIKSLVQSGGSFLGLDNNANLRFINVMNNNGLSETERSNITDIIVVGGWNDVDNLTTHGKTVNQLSNAIREFTNRAAILFPNASVLLCPVGTSVFNTTQRQGYHNMLNCYTNPAMSGAKFAAMSDADCVLTDTTMFRTNQWVHPNNKGGQAIASAIMSTLNGQGIGVHRWWNNTVSGGSGNLSGVVEDIGGYIQTLTSGFYQYQNGRNVELLMLQTSIQMNTETGKYWDGTPGNLQKICTLRDPIFVGSQFSEFQTTVPLNVHTMDDTWINTTGILTMFGKEIKLSVVNVGDSGWEGISVNWLGFTGNVSIRGDAGLCNL